MANFLTDTDVASAGNFQEPEVSLATEFTVPAGTLNAYRVRTGSAAPTNTPQMRTYNAGGSVVGSAQSFDGAWVGPQAWWTATISGGLALTAGTYRMTWNTTHYCAVSGFFSGGSITRSGVTAIQGRFASGVAAPTGTSTALYGIDIDFTPTGGTPFTKTQIEQYRIFNAISVSANEAYRIFNAISKTAAEQYRILNTFGLTAQEQYRILNSWTVAQSEQFRILNAWTKSAAETYAILSGLNVSVSEAYRIFNAWTKTVSDQYAIQAAGLNVSVVERYRLFAAWTRAVNERYAIRGGDASPLEPHVIAKLSAAHVTAYLDRIP